MVHSRAFLHLRASDRRQEARVLGLVGGDGDGEYYATLSWSFMYYSFKVCCTHMCTSLWLLAWRGEHKGCRRGIAAQAH